MEPARAGRGCAFATKVCFLAAFGVVVWVLLDTLGHRVDGRVYVGGYVSGCLVNLAWEAWRRRRRRPAPGTPPAGDSTGGQG
jgi:hypothetical protein